MLAPLNGASVDADPEGRVSEYRGHFSAQRAKRGVLAHARELFRLRHDKSTSRVGLAAVCFLGLFGLIGGRLVHLALTSENTSEVRRAASSEISAARPDIVDRNG